ncbi:MAG TPA: endonuclease domain-containing protein [Verrucomicrobiota bacterium]|nr:endonuclease domain-containing protein [Verrucomicrobiota bacterium]
MSPHMDRITFARQLRRNLTWAERLVWRWLRDRRFEGYKFKRQVPYGSWFLDFFCPEASLAIELDGRQHGFPAQRSLDESKEKYLVSMGVKTLRFWNGELRRREREIKEMIFRELYSRAPHLCPDYWRQGRAGNDAISSL